MLNLLAFEEDQGRDLYMEYAVKTAPHIERVGAEVLYFGEGETSLVQSSGCQWDAVMLIKYPSRQAFLEMVGDAEYQKVTKLRTAALVDAVLQPTLPFGDA